MRTEDQYQCPLESPDTGEEMVDQDGCWEGIGPLSCVPGADRASTVATFGRWKGQMKIGNLVLEGSAMRASHKGPVQRCIRAKSWESSSHSVETGSRRGKASAKTLRIPKIYLGRSVRCLLWRTSKISP